MAWVADEDFNSLTTGAAVNGQGSGTGWSGNWSGSTNFQISTAAPGEGAKAAINSAGSNISRTLAGALGSGTGTVYFALRNESDSAGGAKFRLVGNSGAAILIQIALISGNIVDYTTNVGTYTAATWYFFKLDYDADARTYSFSWSTDGYGTAGTFGTPTSSTSYHDTFDIDSVQLDSDTGSTKYWDYISPTSPYTGGGGAAQPALMMLGVGS